MSKWVITDIHGCFQTFRTLVEERIGFTRSDHLFLLGDYVSKGKDSKKVLDYIIRLKQNGYRVLTLRGNHEQLLLEARYSREQAARLRDQGGEAILQSFGVKKFKDIPDEYWDFLTDLDYFSEIDNYVLVHAGLNFEITDPFQDRDAMLWSRNYQIDIEKIGGRVLIHGHKPIPLKQIKELIEADTRVHINLDNGCVYKNRNDQGNLLALNLENLNLVIQKNIE